MRENLVYAKFVTDNHPPHSHSLLEDTPPQITAAFYAIYPFLIASNRILSFITWTTRSYYRNFVLISIYAILVLHWNDYFSIFLPMLIVLLFCCIAWFIKTCFTDTINSHSPPTLEEILDTSDNFTSRFGFLLNIDSRSTINSEGFLKSLLINISLLTPLYVYFMKNYISCRVWIVCVSLCILLYKSTCFIALRRLLWRLKHIRLFFQFITGKSYPMIDKEIEVTLLNLNIKGTLNENTKIVEFQLLENERRWLGIGWSKKLLFFERSPYCSVDFKHSIGSLDKFEFPKLKNYKQSEWRWLDNNWIVDDLSHLHSKSYPTHNKNPNTWTYYDNNWNTPQDFDSITKYTRTRLLKRRCLVVLKRKDYRP